MSSILGHMGNFEDLSSNGYNRFARDDGNHNSSSYTGAQYSNIGEWEDAGERPYMKEVYNRDADANVKNAHRQVSLSLRFKIYRCISLSCWSFLSCKVVH